MLRSSLEALNSLFDQLADRDEFGPVMVGLGPGPPSGDRPPPSGRPGGFRDDLNEEKDAALLQSILVFFDRFAERNETTPGSSSRPLAHSERSPHSMGCWAATKRPIRPSPTPPSASKR